MLAFVIIGVSVVCFGIGFMCGTLWSFTYLEGAWSNGYQWKEND